MKITFAWESVGDEQAAGILSATELLGKKLKHGKCCSQHQ